MGKLLSPSTWSRFAGTGQSQSMRLLAGDMEVAGCSLVGMSLGSQAERPAASQVRGHIYLQSRVSSGHRSSISRTADYHLWSS